MKRVAFATILIVAMYLAGCNLGPPTSAFAQPDTAYRAFWKQDNLPPVVFDHTLSLDELRELVRNIANFNPQGPPVQGAANLACRLSRLIEPTLPACTANPNIPPIQVNPQGKPFIGDASKPLRLVGLGGMFTHPIVLAADKILNEPVPADDVRVQLHGNIIGYSFDLNSKSGSLVVQTISYIEDSAGTITSPEITQVWHIAVHPGTYVVRGRVPSPVNPFPNTMNLPQEVLDELQPGGELEHMTYKLFAEGEGIEVTAIYQSEDGAPFNLLDKNDPVDGLLYQTDADSCIDIFFDQFPPPTNIPPKPHYCLGRCETPAIIGTM